MKTIKWYKSYTAELTHKGNNFKYNEVSDVFNDDFKTVLNRLYDKYAQFEDADAVEFYTVEDLRAGLYRGASEKHYLTYCEPYKIVLTNEQYNNLIEWLDGEEFTPSRLENWIIENNLYEQLIAERVDFSTIIEDIREVWEEVRADREEDE